MEAIDAMMDNEILLAFERFGNVKASGLDDIPNRVLKIAIKHNIRPFTKVYMKCLTMKFVRECEKLKDWQF